MSLVAGNTSSDFRLDTSGTRRVPFSRLVSVEARKMVDTRAGLWLMIVIAVVTLGAVLLFSFLSDAESRTFPTLMVFTLTPQGFLLPVLGILLVTGEWGQRTTLTTFVLESSRLRVILAKVVAALGFGLLFIVLAMVVAALAAAVGGAADPFEGVGVGTVGRVVLMQELSVLQGFAYGLLLLNSAAAIVVFFVVPMAFNIILTMWGAVREIAPWIDLGTASMPLMQADGLTGEHWAHLASAAAIWVLAPLALGLLRVLRVELK